MSVQMPSPASRFLETYSGPSTEATEPGASVRRYERLLMGTWNVLLLVDRREEPLSGEALDREAAMAFQRMESLEEELSKFLPESEVSLMNALAASQPVAVSQNVFHLLEVSRQYWEATGGAFDPTVGPLMATWGFDDGAWRVPGDEEIAHLLESRGMNHVHLDPDRKIVFFDRPGITIDFGAIGKGYVVDQVVLHLKEAGVSAGALISGRSTLVAWGKPPDGNRWRVGVANPLNPDEDILELSMEEGALSSSAAYEKKFHRGGKSFGHILDPRTGRPVRHSLGVTVWTNEAVQGDVASTSLFVLGHEEGRAVLDRLAPLSVVFVEEDPSAPGEMQWRETHRGVKGFQVERP